MTTLKNVSFLKKLVWFKKYNILTLSQTVKLLSEILKMDTVGQDEGEDAVDSYILLACCYVGNKNIILKMRFDKI
jgi:hypothetical protein